jgi:hypothetical protein
MHPDGDSAHVPRKGPAGERRRRAWVGFRWYVVGLVIAVILLVVLTTVRGGPLSSKTQPAPPAPTGRLSYVPPQIPPGLRVKQSVVTLERRVRNDIGPHSKITGVVVVAQLSDVNRYVPQLGHGPGVSAKGPVWIIRAFGLFEPITIPSGAHALTTPRAGWFLFDDKTGVSLGYGF